MPRLAQFAHGNVSLPLNTVSWPSTFATINSFSCRPKEKKNEKRKTRTAANSNNIGYEHATETLCGRVVVGVLILHVIVIAPSLGRD